MRRGERGFTLLELIISVALLALLSVILFGGLRLGTRHLGTASDRVERASRVRSLSASSAPSSPPPGR